MAAVAVYMRNSLARTANILRRTACNAVLVGSQHKTLHTLHHGVTSQTGLLTQQPPPFHIAGQIRWFAESKLTKEQIRERVLKVCAAFDKVTADKLSVDSHFLNDLGLDSLDHVEIIMAMEDEFGFEIPDGDAEKLVRPADIVQYVADKEDIYD